MALLYYDGFETEKDEASLYRRWNTHSHFGGGAPTVIQKEGRYGGMCLSSGPDEVYNLTKYITPPSPDTIIFGFDFRCDRVLGSSFVVIRDSGGARLFEFLFTQSDATGFFVHLRRRFGDTIDTSTVRLAPDIWHQIQVKVVLHGSLGSYEVRTLSEGNDSPVVAMSGIDNTTDSGGTVWGRFNLVTLSQVSVGSTYNDIDNLYICDDSGSKNNDFLGPVDIESLYPNAIQGGSSQYTVTGASAVGAVNDAADLTTADADYVSDPELMSVQSYQFTAPSRLSGTLYAAMLLTEAKNQDDSVDVDFAGMIATTNARNFTRHERTVSDGTKFESYETIYEDDPF